VLTRAKAMGLKASCINNFKQLGICYRMYVDDNNDYLPPNFGGSGTAFTNTWVIGDAQTDVTTLHVRQGLLYQYNQSAALYVCPANTLLLTVTVATPNPPFGVLKIGQQVPQTRTCSIEYSMGGNTVNSEQGPWTCTDNGYTWNSYQKFSSIQATRVATKMVFDDESSGGVGDGALGTLPLGTGNIWWNTPASRHLNGGVFSFADGHVEYWKWHGTVLIASQSNGGHNEVADTSDDLPRVQAGGPQYP